MPFDKKYQAVYENVIKPSMQSDLVRLECVRVDELRNQGSILADIVREICESDVIIADLSERNPNVFYE